MTAEKLGFNPSCISAKGELIAIGNKEGNDCFIYTKSGASLSKQKELGISEPITAVQFRYFFCQINDWPNHENFSDDGSKLAVADKTNCIHTFDTKNFTLIEKLYGHRARITQLAWSSNGWLASGNSVEKKCIRLTIFRQYRSKSGCS